MGMNRFPKSERLYKKKSIQELFQKGSSFYLYPFKVYTLTGDAPASQMLVSVSKRNFKKAVDRNAIKRRVREAFRLSKVNLPPGSTFQIAYIYTAKEILEVVELRKKIQESFKRFNKA
jgi:ribonuclease P protein component